MLLGDFRYKSNSQPTIHELMKFKAKFGNNLDPKFIEFLEHQNGGAPIPSLVSSNYVLKYPIMIFWGLDSSKSNLMSAYHQLQEDIHKPELLPIAYDMGMRDICICLDSAQSEVYVVSIDRMYYSSPTAVVKVSDSFGEFVDSLSQPDEAELEFEILAKLRWPELQSEVAKNRELYLGAPTDQLSLLCQTIRFGNIAAFEGLLMAGADVNEAMEIAVLNNRIDFVKKLVDAGVSASEGIEFATGPDRKELRDFLSKNL